jgi:hypothetical protein
VGQPKCSYRCTHFQILHLDLWVLLNIRRIFLILIFLRVFFPLFPINNKALFSHEEFLVHVYPKIHFSTPIVKRLHSNLFKYKICSRYNCNVDRVHTQLKSHVSSVVTKSPHCVTHDGACDCCVAIHVSNLSFHNRPTKYMVVYEPPHPLQSSTWTSS